MKVHKLYEYPEQFAAIDRALDETEGELTPELEALLDELQVGWETRVKGYCALIKNHLATAEACRNEAQRLSKRASSAERIAENIKSRLKNSMELTGQRKVETDAFKVHISKNSRPTIRLREGLSLLDAMDENPSFVRLEPKLQSDAVLAAWKAGEDVSALFDVVEGTHLRIS